MPKYGFVLIDCGNGTVGQIYRKFGIELGNYILSNIKCIWLSHAHNDHSGGLINLLMKKKGDIFVFAPKK